jgi:excisionase family DNA binding protein
MLPALLTVRETADALRVNPRTIERWTAEGRLRRVKLAPRCVRYRADDVAELIASDESPAATARLSSKSARTGRDATPV